MLKSTQGSKMGENKVLHSVQICFYLGLLLNLQIEQRLRMQ